MEVKSNSLKRDSGAKEAVPCGPAAFVGEWNWRNCLFCCSCSMSKKSRELPYHLGDSASDASRTFLCTVKQRTTCSLCSFCCWFLAAIVVGFSLFFLGIYWTCVTVPITELGTKFEPSGDPSVGLRETNGTIRVLSWNVYLRSEFVPEESPGEFKDERLQEIIDVFDDFDLLMLQEVWSVWDNGREKRLIDAAQEKGFKYYVRSECSRGGIDTLTSGMLLIMSRHPIVDAAEVTYEKSEGIDRFAAKGVLWARVKFFGLDECEMDAFTTHLQAGGSDETKRSQLSQLNDFVHEKTKTGRGEALITGDFNLNGRSSDTDGTFSPEYFTMLDALGWTPASDDYITRGSTFDLINLLAEDNGGEMPVTATGGGIYSIPSPLVGSGIDYGFYLAQNSSELARIPFTAVNDPFEVASEPYRTLSDHIAVRFDLRCNAV